MGGSPSPSPSRSPSPRHNPSPTNQPPPPLRPRPTPRPHRTHTDLQLQHVVLRRRELLHPPRDLPLRDERLQLLLWAGEAEAALGHAVRRLVVHREHLRGGAGLVLQTGQQRLQPLHLGLQRVARHRKGGPAPPSPVAGRRPFPRGLAELHLRQATKLWKTVAAEIFLFLRRCMS